MSVIRWKHVQGCDYQEVKIIGTILEAAYYSVQ